jgi:hypothetical protein
VWLHQQQHVNRLHGKVQMERRSIPTWTVNAQEDTINCYIYPTSPPTAIKLVIFSKDMLDCGCSFCIKKLNWSCCLV